MIWRRRHRLGAVAARPARPSGEEVAPNRPDHLWALEFQLDKTEDGRAFKLLYVVDEFTREALAAECHRRIDTGATLAVLDRLAAERRGFPEHLRCDTASLPTAQGLSDWCSQIGAEYVDPDARRPVYVESFGARIRAELLAGEPFFSIFCAQVEVESWRQAHNEYLPHAALGMQPAARFARTWWAHHQAFDVRRGTASTPVPTPTDSRGRR